MQNALTEIQCRAACGPLDGEWARRVGRLGIERARNVARDVVRNAKPIALIAIDGLGKSLIALRAIINRDNCWIGKKTYRPFVANPHAGAWKHDEALRDRSRIAKVRMLYGTPKRAYGGVRAVRQHPVYRCGREGRAIR